ncbi:MAG: metal-dependent phosphohydrolase [Treponema sp.]|nr:metal-dependent phosphohydrolase [Treponema sp.]MCL2272474.1 metal-dependent phosphohydrolase [Treponema sp.]
MPEKEHLTPLSAILSPQDGKGINKKYIEIILEEEIPVFCLNKNSKKERLMPFRSLYGSYSINFWLQSSEWDYYLTEDYFEKLKEKAIEKTGAWEFYEPEQKKTSAVKPGTPEEEPEEHQSEEVAAYGNEYSSFAKMPTEKKVDWLNKNKQRLNELIAKKNKEIEAVVEVLVDTTKDAALINHTVLAEAIQLGDDEAKKLTQDIVDSTHEMVKSSAQLLSEDIFNNDLMKTLVEKSNGTIVQHMTRVYLNGVAFLAYYNNLVTTSSAIQKLRISFVAKYRPFYHRLLPHINIDDVVLERVFLGGMRSIAPEIFFKWAVGFLIHDIGKASAIQYHEGEAAYIRSTVVEHVKTGYKSIMTKTNYPMEASLITGYHHEYYGSSDGYGYFRANLNQYKKSYPDAKQDYCITYDLEPILDYQALAYFPAKVLEIIDVFDSVTDPNRVYRKALSSKEALEMIRTEFVEKHRKIDIILFDIFDSFIREKEKLN